MPLIKFGKTINNCSLESLSNLLRVSKGKVKIDLEGADLDGIYARSRFQRVLTYTSVDQITEDDRKHVFDLHTQKLKHLLTFILSKNEVFMDAKTTRVVNGRNRYMRFIEVAQHDEDPELLDLLLSLESEKFTGQMGEITQRQTNTTKFINTVNFDIWATLANNLVMFTPHQEYFLFGNFIQLQQEKQELFNESMKFWHARHGPAMPQEIVTNLMAVINAYDFTKEQVHMYPERLYVRVGNQYTDVLTKSAYCFVTIRKKLWYWWAGSTTGPKIDTEWSQGIESRPLDITDLGVSLQDFKLLTMILDDNDHENIKNLTGETINRLDKLTFILKMDTYRFLYNGRTRLGDQTGHTIVATFYGENKARLDKAPSEHMPGFTEKFDSAFADEDTRTATVLEIPMPDRMACCTFHRVEMKEAEDRTNCCAFNYFKHNVSFGIVTSYAEQNKSYAEASAIETAKLDVEARISQGIHYESLYQIDQMYPGVKCRFDTIGEEGDECALKKL